MEYILVEVMDGIPSIVYVGTHEKALDNGIKVLTELDYTNGIEEFKRVEQGYNGSFNGFSHGEYSLWILSYDKSTIHEGAGKAAE